MASNTRNKKQMKDAINTASSEMFSPQQSASSKKSVESSLTSASSLSSQSSRVSSSRATDSTLRASENDSVTSGRRSFSPTKILVERGLIGSPANMGYDVRQHLQQIMKLSDSEYSEDDDDYSVESYESESDDREDELKQLVSRRDHPSTPKPSNPNTITSDALVPIEEDELDSEEENEIMKEIKEEIKNQVRGEMKSELEVYRAKKEQLESGDQASSNKPGIADDLENLEPKLREAFIKMRKLDKILAKRVRREKDVKRDRILLERRIRSEIEDLKNQGGGQYKEVTANTQKFLALELPPSHNEGVQLPEDTPETPVFRTQLNENEYPEFNTRQGKRAGGSRASRAGSEEQDRRSEGGDTASTVSGGRERERKHRRKHRKNFIKRNKELAADADNVIAMTEEEKKRLEDLLKDVENISEIPEEDTEGADNPFQLAVRPGEGYQPDLDESRSLSSIDARLRELLPPEEFELVSSRSALSQALQHKLFTRTGVKASVEIDKCGEKVLIENREERDLGERLKAIEEELAKLHNPEEIEIETPHLEEDQLRDLIDQCVTSLSHVSMSRTSMLTDPTASRVSFTDQESIAETIDTAPRSPRSARQEVLDNPPRLDPEVLQKLLSEAYYPMSSHLSTLQEEENEDEGSTPIPAEVWKLISMETGETESKTANTADHKPGKPDKSKLKLGSRQTSQELMEKRARTNGPRNNSRMSSQSSLSNGANSDNGRDSEMSGRDSEMNGQDSELSGRDSELSGRDSKTPFLPPIDPAGTMITQGLNNQQRSNSGSVVRTPVALLRNSLTDSKNDNCDTERMEVVSLDGDFPTPRPPTSEKRHSSNKFRNVTPVNK